MAGAAVHGSERNSRVGAPVGHKPELPVHRDKYCSSLFVHHHSSLLLPSCSSLPHHRRPTPRPPAQDDCERIEDHSAFIAIHPFWAPLADSSRSLSLFSDIWITTISVAGCLSFLTSFIRPAQRYDLCSHRRRRFVGTTMYSSPPSLVEAMQPLHPL